MAATNPNGIDVIRTATDTDNHTECDYCGEASSDVSPHAIADGSFTNACDDSSCQTALRADRQTARKHVA